MSRQGVTPVSKWASTCRRCRATAAGITRWARPKIFLSYCPVASAASLGTVIAALAAIPHSVSSAGTYYKEKVLKVVSFHCVDSTKTMTIC